MVLKFPISDCHNTYLQIRIVFIPGMYILTSLGMYIYVI